MCCVFLCEGQDRIANHLKTLQNETKSQNTAKVGLFFKIKILCYTRSLVQVILSQYISDIYFLFLENATLRNISRCINF